MAGNRWQTKPARNIQAIDLQKAVEKGLFHFAPILTEQAFRLRLTATGLGSTFLIDLLPY